MTTITSMNIRDSLRRNRLMIFVLLVQGLFLVSGTCARADPLHPLAPEQDRAFSEFNHHLAGWFLLGIGLTALLARASRQLAGLDMVWPFLFILPGLYLLVMSDPEVWPMGHQSLLDALSTNVEARQHKIYALLLLALGVLELLRAQGRLRPFAATWAFPALAVFGAVFLFFHAHGGGEHAMAGMADMPAMSGESMTRIKGEHLAFSIVGFGITLFKVLSDGGFWQRKFVPFLWPSCMSVLGVLLILYRE